MEKHDKDLTDEYITKSLNKFAKGKSIDLFYDLCPEYRDLKYCSYSYAPPPGSPEGVKERPSYNLNYLLTSSLYDKIIVPLVPHTYKSSFKYFYGFGRYRGCKIDFETFIRLIEEEKIKITLTAPPTNYNKDFYKDLFKICEKQDYLPSFVSRRISGFYLFIRLAEIAASHGIPSDNEWWNTVLTMHPEYDWNGCFEEVMQIIEDDKNKIREIERALNLKREDIFEDIVTSLRDLRAFGYDAICDEIILECLKKDINYGYDKLKSFCRYLIEPVSDAIFGYTNYDFMDIKDMHSLRVLPENLAYLWKDILSSYPLNSSVISDSVEINLVELDARELLNLLTRYEEKETKDCVIGIKRSLDEFDVSKASMYYKKINEIITERYNKEIRGYYKREKLVRYGIRFGEYFTYAAEELPSLLSITSADFKWIITALLLSVATKLLRKKLEKIEPKDVIKWLVKKMAI